MLNWVKQFSIFCLLDNHQYQIEPHTVECLLAVGAKRHIDASRQNNDLATLQEFISTKPSWLFGHLNYDLKNEIECLSSSGKDRIGFPDYYFFEPEILIQLKSNEILIHAENAQDIFQAIINTDIRHNSINESAIGVNAMIPKDEYVAIIEKLRQHILRGDCYEINFCQEFFAENCSIDPLMIYTRLTGISPNPFSALYRLQDKFLLCASPERFLKKAGKHILSQPIKGTARRVLNNAKQDQLNGEALYHSEKDRSENVMVVDLVRNDLAKVCREGTVKVDELYGVYAFPQVYQMISTISGELKDDMSFTAILKATFPMGSMTGAPKRNVMKLIEQYEKTKRGIFSGALGYITPDDDFDFNVVIRSIMYNAANANLSYQVGSGITFYSEPEKEWEECLLKAEAIRDVLASK
ncbi:MAG: anthranilate synthase component I family protein [Chitinophagaceae bacterium]